MGELRETINELFNLQSNKLFRTIKGLTVAPGNTIRTFAGGDRATFIHPFTYLMTFIGISLFLGTMIPTAPSLQKDILDSENKVQELSSRNELSLKEKKDLEYEIFTLEVAKYIKSENGKRHNTYISLFLFSIIHVLVFRNLKFGFKKNIWFSFLVSGHNYLIFSVLLCPLGFFLWHLDFNLEIYIVAIVIYIIYQSWAACQFYEISFSRALKKNIFNSLICFTIQLLFGLILVVSYQYYIYKL